MEAKSGNTSPSSSESQFEDFGQPSDHPGDELPPLHSATATTDYSAFTGREEYLSSDEDASVPKAKRVSKARAKKSRKAQQAHNSSSKAAAGPLRPAQDILARLRHDPQLSSQSFTVGYIDRHSPQIMELPLSSWKGGDVTDEEFIPQHRILWFKRDSDGKKVWDRRERLDIIFGSGLSKKDDGHKDIDVDTLSKPNSGDTTVQEEHVSPPGNGKEGDVR
ncbi:MAG: hypothetical protein Q9191_002417 [Dirinaria sp. TL-2023a]